MELVLFYYSLNLIALKISSSGTKWSMFYIFTYLNHFFFMETLCYEFFLLKLHTKFSYNNVYFIFNLYGLTLSLFSLTWDYFILQRAGPWTYLFILLFCCIYNSWFSVLNLIANLHLLPKRFVSDFLIFRVYWNYLWD